MTILVSDANIFIDMDVSNLTRSMFRLNETFATPDVLYREELEEHHADLPRFGLRIEQLDSAGIVEVGRISAIYNQTSTNDVFAIVLAKERQWSLLTGDQHMRNAALEEGVEVRGTVWLIRRMVETKIISIIQARASMKLMRNGGRRLPWDEVDEMIRQLENN